MRLLYKLLLIVIIITALFLGFWRPEKSINQSTDVTVLIANEYYGYEVRELEIAGTKYRVFVADTPELRSHGLSGKTGLPEGHGMEFVFDAPGVYGFWMKDMQFPLDIIWSRDGVVVDVWERASVPVGADIPSYTPKGEADRVYEFTAGFAALHGIKIGQDI